jgi:hypothetical protein
MRREVVRAYLWPMSGATVVCLCYGIAGRVSWQRGLAGLVWLLGIITLGQALGYSVRARFWPAAALALVGLLWWAYGLQWLDRVAP